MRERDDQVVDEGHADIELLERIAARDPRALSDLYDRHSRLLFGLLLRILRDRGDAEDMLQEVFLAVWLRAETYHRTLGSPVGWLVGIARNRGIDRLRANNVRTRNLEGVDVREVVSAAPAIDSPESKASRKEVEGGVSNALGALPRDQRALLEHAYYLGLTHSELAERFQLPLGTVKTRVRAGMTALRQELERARVVYGG